MQKVGPFRNKKGFTIIEVVVIIVVIGILAAILLVAYNAWVKNAANAVRYDEVKAWEKSLKLYKATYRNYPDPGHGYYCLGTGFPDIDSDGQTDCRDLWPSTPTLEHPNAYINTELAKVGSLPKGNRTPIAGHILGPFAYYDGPDAYIEILQDFDGNKCPNDMSVEYDYNTETPPTSAIMCRLVVAPY